jgi:hypothetical protein
LSGRKSLKSRFFGLISCGWVLFDLLSRQVTLRRRHIAIVVYAGDSTDLEKNEKKKVFFVHKNKFISWRGVVLLSRARVDSHLWKFQVILGEAQNDLNVISGMARNRMKSHGIARNCTKSHGIARNRTKSHEIAWNRVKSHGRCDICMCVLLPFWRIWEDDVSFFFGFWFF